MIFHTFNEKLEFSLGGREAFDIALIMGAIPGCVEVTKTNAELDKDGVDYQARLRGGTVINIDAKAREPGAARFWKHGEPELALEKWSVIKECGNPGKTGWTLKESTPVDMILYTFDAKDSDRFYLIPFQHLRMAFVRFMRQWEQLYPWRKQWSNGWRSEAMFVPASVVIAAVAEVMHGEMKTA